ncbi:MAG TPA: SpoIID/LytB domain-containing protein [Acidimicrobiales bacterium]|nr:SpoIID/LytB domain-containing protein [Acidimicrobiales bacterium]
MAWRAALALVVTGLVVGAPAAAAPRAKPKPAPAPRGWLVDRVRVEPVGDSILGVHGVGDYRGALELVAAGNGGVGVVNDLGLDDYLKGLSEVPSTWPAEALKAQAIAARTYALHERSVTVATAARALGADICATDACQVYTGLAKERGPNGPAWAAAVEATSGQALLYRDAPILAKYSSSNGGQTVSGGRPYLRAAPDPDDAHSPLHRWRSSIPASTVAAVVGLPADTRITRVSRMADSTVVLERIEHDGSVAPAFTIPAVDFRARLNAAVPAPADLPLAVPSNRFSVAYDNGADAVVVDGRGWGHGIGMSQYGALGKALRGMRAEDILASYYGGLRPVAVPAQSLPPTIKVAVDLGRPTAAVVGSGAFRVLDQSGAPLAVFTGGPWEVVPAGKGKLRIVPPPGQDAVPAVHPHAVAALQPGSAPELTFDVSTPAAVEVAVVAPGATAPTVLGAARLVAAGPVTQSLPPLSTPGRYTVTITADAGGGRRATATVEFEVHPPTDASAAAPAAATLPNGPAAPRSPGFLALAAAAALALAAVGLDAARRLH